MISLWLLVAGFTEITSAFTTKHYHTGKALAFHSVRQPLPHIIYDTNCHAPRTTTSLEAALSQDGSSVVGIVGRGFLSVLVAKISALSGYNTWVIVPEGEQSKAESVVFDEVYGDTVKPKLEFIPAKSMASVAAKIPETDAMILAVDGDGCVDPKVMEFLFNPEQCPKLERIVAMSRNLNGKGMGVMVQASKTAANSDVWSGDSKLIFGYKEFESQVAAKAKACGAEYTIVRAGTLKGGGCGDKTSMGENAERSEDEPPAYYPRYLTPKYYEYTKKDIVTWQLLFDCAVRGVTMSKGDTMEGPGFKAMFTAASPEECLGDTSRCALAEAMVRSLALPEAANIDFAVGTKASRVPPTEEEWITLFKKALS